jgi:hypothetical protein
MFKKRGNKQFRKKDAHGTADEEEEKETPKQEQQPTSIEDQDEIKLPTKKLKKQVSAKKDNIEPTTKKKDSTLLSFQEVKLLFSFRFIFIILFIS